MAFLAAGLLLLTIFNACKHTADDVVIAGPGDTTINTSPCSPDTVYFVNTVLPMLRSNCAESGCHDAATAKSDVVMENYTSIMKEVKAGNVSGSKLYEVISGGGEEGMPPDSKPPLSNEQKSALNKWITQGAKNNSCTDQSCDSVNVSFAGNIFPIIKNSCTGCHSGNNPGSGIKLTTYAEITAIANNGKLSGTIKHLSGFKPMPTGLRLSNCDIAKINTWIYNGTPNN